MTPEDLTQARELAKSAIERAVPARNPPDDVLASGDPMVMHIVTIAMDIDQLASTLLTALDEIEQLRSERES